MNSIVFYIAFDPMEDPDFPMVCPTYFDEEEARENHPDCEIIEVERMQMDINLN